MMSTRFKSNQLDDPAWGQRGTAGPVFAGAISFENVSYEIDGHQILRDVSFALHPGEIACLLGPSGCGKTSLLRLAAGVAIPSRGRILLDGKEISGPTRYAPPEKRGVGMMFQDYALFPHMTVFENVAYGLTALSKTDAAFAARHALDRVGLLRFCDAYPNELSGGEQQRVALARAIVPRPQVMLMDEPFSGLDQRLRDTVRKETLALLKETRATAMLVTHDPVEAMDVGDRIILMREGRLVQAGSPETVYNAPVDAAAARFFSDFNEFSGIIADGHVATPLGRFAAPAHANGSTVTVMVRPQAIGQVASNAELAGQVVDSRFLGDRARCTIALSGVDLLVTALFSAHEAPAKGAVVGLDINPADVLIFTKDQVATN